MNSKAKRRPPSKNKNRSKSQGGKGPGNKAKSKGGQEQGQGQQPQGKRPGNRSKRPNTTNNKPKTLDFADYKPRKPKVINYLVFDTHKQAQQAETEIKVATEGCDQLNIYLKAEGHMDDPEILAMSDKITIYAGEAWCLIHSRRLEEKWYDQAH